MKLIIGLIFGVVIFILLKRLWQKNSNSNTPNAVISYGLIFLATLVFIAIVDFTIRYFEIIKGDLFVQRNPSEIIKNINIKNIDLMETYILIFFILPRLTLRVSFLL